MGGKSDAPAPPPPVEPAGGLDMGMMMQMMAMMMGNMSAPQAPIPQIPDAPELEEDPEFDFDSRQKELAQKVAADYATEQDRKRGRADTILTSPLLDEDLQKDASLLTD